jgi:hypothetical protein
MDIDKKAESEKAGKRKRSGVSAERRKWAGEFLTTDGHSLLH